MKSRREFLKISGGILTGLFLTNNMANGWNLFKSSDNGTKVIRIAVIPVEVYCPSC